MGQQVDWFSLVAAKALRQLNHGVDLYAVLRGHLWLERDVLDLLQLKGHTPDPGFKKRIKQAHKNNLLDDGDYAFLKILNRVRNGFAHELEREALSREDDDALFNASGGLIRDLYARLTVEVEEPETSRAEGLRFRGLIAAMHLHLLQRITDTKAGLR